MRAAAFPQRPTQEDHGSSVTEYAALLVLVAAVFVAITVSAVPGRTADLIEYSICLIEKQAFGADTDCSLEGGGTGDSSEADGPETEDFIPPLCEKGSTQETSTFNVKVLATFDSGTSISRVERADGSVWFIAEPANKKGGVEFGYGARINAGNYGTTNRNAHVNGTYDWGQGQIWTFDPDQRDEADAFEQQLRDETSIGSNPVSALWDDTFGDGPDLPEPQMEVESWGATGRGDVGIDSGLLLGDPEGSDKSNDKGEIDMGPSVSLDAKGAYENIVRANRTDPDNVIISQTHQVQGTVDGSGTVMLGAGASGGLGWSAAVRDDRTDDGELNGILLSASFDKRLSFKYGMPMGFSGGNVADVGPKAGAGTDIANQTQDTFIYLEFDNDEERQVAERFLDEYGGIDGPPTYFFETMLGDHGFVEEDPGPDGDPWEKLVYDKAQVWQSTHERDFTDWSVGASGRYKLVTLGAGYAEHDQERITTDAWYLGAPEADGTRPTVRYDECITDD